MFFFFLPDLSPQSKLRRDAVGFRVYGFFLFFNPSDFYICLQSKGFTLSRRKSVRDSGLRFKATIVENQLERTWNMTWPLGLSMGCIL